ncbi:hypothetical protein GCM10010977_17770 [Citricoccus zhacaiensis]|uniref:WXG100 family type VII secretion target n=1 Tax=Citricoccus zhacaiensis TaxID=489142 RepID=A0ABQ2M0C7_9MICC|nr:hypothetical protein [Citricoccus zhacaiensis]GGO45311.1 hypothetical protein GCM10010977_17770 [Citricoccus zhacaiensis]
MVAYGEVHFAETGTDGRHAGRWSGLAPWVVDVVRPDSAVQSAGNAQIELNSIFNKLMEIARTWNGFKEYYHGTDAATVHANMDNMVGRISAITEAGDLFLAAAEGYVGSMNSGLHEIKEAEDEWAAGFVERLRAYKSDRDTLHEEDEFKPKYDGRTKEQVGSDLTTEETDHQPPAEQMPLTINQARFDFREALKAINLEDLSDLRFETRDESVVAVETPEDLKFQIMNSAMFSQLGLTEEQAQELAEQIMEDGTWDDHADFVDDQGRAWVMTPEGNMVRVGSQLDPEMGQTVLETVAEDSNLAPRLDRVKLPGMSESVGTALETAGIPLGEGAGTVGDHLAKEGIKHNFHVPGVMGAIGLNAAVGLASAGISSQQYKQDQAGQYFMLSGSDLQERTERVRHREFAIYGMSTLASKGLSVVTAAPTGGASLIVGVVIDEVTGEIIGWVVETIDDRATTASVHEINESTDADLVANSEPERDL